MLKLDLTSLRKQAAKQEDDKKFIGPKVNAQKKKLTQMQSDIDANLKGHKIPAGVKRMSIMSPEYA